MASHIHPLGTVEQLDDEELGAFSDGLRGDLILPDAEAYEDVRNVWNGLINKYPAVVVRVKGANDVARSVFVDELSDERIDILLERTDAAPSPLSATAVWPMGGNVGHGPDAAFQWDDKGHMVTIEANWEGHDTPANLAWARETERQLRATGAEGAYAGFTGVEVADWEQWPEQVYGDGYDRLARIKAEYDPDNVFRHNVNVEPRGIA